MTEDRVALIDLDGTVADYDTALQDAMRAIQAPNEPPYNDRYTGGVEPPYIEARRKLVQRVPGFWKNLRPLPSGFEVIDDLRNAEFALHVLTKGPQKNPTAWGEKLEWCMQYLSDATVHVTGEKSLTYGRILFDDFPPYFLSWLKHRPRGLVICLAHPWNIGFAKGGDQEHPNVFRYEGVSHPGGCAHRNELREAIKRARDRAPREPLNG
jgi:5'(3')-deoxyribonucleotidase